MRRLSLVAVSGASLCYGALAACVVVASHCGAFFCGAMEAPDAWASVVVVHGLESLCNMWDLPGQGSSLCPMHRQVPSVHWTTRVVPLKFFSFNSSGLEEN